jgi:anti-sigma28 factor (negative regulator of flagellin synthesis)
MSISNGIGSLQGLSNTVTPASQTAPAGKEQQIKTAVPVHVAPKVNQAVDQAVISSTSGLLTQALNASDIRLHKVLPLQQAIASGSYDVASSDVADKVISSLGS